MSPFEGIPPARKFAYIKKAGLARELVLHSQSRASCSPPSECCSFRSFVHSSRERFQME